MMGLDRVLHKLLVGALVREMSQLTTLETLQILASLAWCGLGADFPATGDPLPRPCPLVEVVGLHPRPLPLPRPADLSFILF